MKENFIFQQKTKLLTKLFGAGCNTENKQTKANKLFSCLGGGIDEQA